jgi:hypothetical protein
MIESLLFIFLRPFMFPYVFTQCSYLLFCSHEHIAQSNIP